MTVTKRNTSNGRAAHKKYQQSMKTVLGKRARAERGLPNGTIPFGYIKGDNGVPIPHPMNAEGVRKVFQAYATGQNSDAQIAELLNQDGHRTTGHWGARPFTKDTVNRMLRNAFYLGYVKHKGELLPGQHEALIDQELFDKCQAVRTGLRNRSRSSSQKRRVYILAGLARCKDCELTLRCYATNSAGKWRYMRHTAQERGYDCPVGKASLRADQLEEQWGGIVSCVTLPLVWRERIEQLVGEVEQTKSSGSSHPGRRVGCPENLGALWAHATLSEKRTLTRLMVSAVYVDLLTKGIVSVEPLPIFRRMWVETCSDLVVGIV